MVVGAISSAFLLYAPSVIGLSGVWSGLTLFMGLRTVAGYMRYVLNCEKSFSLSLPSLSFANCYEVKLDIYKL